MVAREVLGTGTAKDRFRFRKHASIGAADAEEDAAFLQECFVDTGDLQALQDCSHTSRIVIGRTGSGKTALLSRLASNPNAITVQPETLSFSYITNSTILNFFVEAGVKLDLFFKLLWRHVLTVELLKRRYNITNEATKRSFRERLGMLFSRDAKKHRAIEYLEKWGEEFWKPTEYRIREITSRVESDLKGSIGSNLPGIDASVTAASKLGEEQRAEVHTRGQAIINDIQMRELSDILDFLNEDVFTDDHNPFYICIDRLDEDWVEERFRYALIRSLIETVRDFRRVENVKIVIALRSDLLDRVFRITRDSGFQEEKYRSLYLRLRWNQQQLKLLLDKRINFLVRQTYTKDPVGYSHLLPKEILKKPTIEYILERTLRRPRELIEFFNDCIELAADRPTITKDMILRAEARFSRDRLRSLQDEWHSDYPRLIEFSRILSKRKRHFRLETITTEEIEEWCLDYATREGTSDRMSGWALSVAEGDMGARAFLSTAVYVFYKTGLVGVKVDTSEDYQWSFEGIEAVSSQAINMQTVVAVHPSFFRVLGIR